MGDLREALVGAAERIAGYREGLGAARVTPVATRAEVRGALGDFSDGPTPLDDVIEELVSGATPGLMSSAGPRYFGFVTGGSVDAALVAETLAAGWDQCAFNEAMSPAALAFEDVAGGWLKEILGLPTSASVGFVTGAQAANTVGLASARWSVLHDRGWDVGRDGSTAHRGCESWSARSATRRSTGQCACSASAKARWRSFLLSPTERWTPRRWEASSTPGRPFRRSSVCRRAT